jgi:hypothetical protein
LRPRFGLAGVCEIAKFASAEARAIATNRDVRMCMNESPPIDTTGSGV